MSLNAIQGASGGFYGILPQNADVLAAVQNGDTWYIQALPPQANPNNYSGGGGMPGPYDVAIDLVPPGAASPRFGWCLTYQSLLTPFALSGGGNPGPVPVPVPVPTGGGPLPIVLSDILKALAPSLATALLSWITQAGHKQGDTVQSSEMPAWLSTVIAILGGGVAGGVFTLIVDRLAAGSSAGGTLPASSPNAGAQYVKSWRIGRATYYLLPDGKRTIQRANGTWKKPFRMPKNLVLSRGKKMNLKNFLKVDRAVKLESVKIKKAYARSNEMVRQRMAAGAAPRPRRARALPAGPLVPLVDELLRLRAPR